MFHEPKKILKVMSSEHETRERDPLLRLLRELPDHKAPATLVGRVQGAIRARAPLPWWRRPLTEWPPFTRFLGVACGLAASAAILWFGAALVGDIVSSHGECCRVSRLVRNRAGGGAGSDHRRAA